VDSYLNYNHAKNELKTKIKRYLEFIYSQKDYYPDQTELFKDLSVKLRNELSSFIFTSYFNQPANTQEMAYFEIEHFQPGFLKRTYSGVSGKVILFMKRKYSPNEVIIQEFERSKNN
jgi:hypothetical protein